MGGGGGTKKKERKKCLDNSLCYSCNTVPKTLTALCHKMKDGLFIVVFFTTPLPAYPPSPKNEGVDQ